MASPDAHVRLTLVLVFTQIITSPARIHLTAVPGMDSMPALTTAYQSVIYST